MINCKIVSTTETTAYNDLLGVVLCTSSGEVELLPDHAEYFSLLIAGDVILYHSEKKDRLRIEGGACHFLNNELVIVL